MWIRSSKRISLMCLKPCFLTFLEQHHDHHACPRIVTALRDSTLELSWAPEMSISTTPVRRTAARAMREGHVASVFEKCLQEGIWLLLQHRKLHPHMSHSIPHHNILESTRKAILMKWYEKLWALDGTSNMRVLSQSRGSVALDSSEGCRGSHDMSFWATRLRTWSRMFSVEPVLFWHGCKDRR